MKPGAYLFIMATGDPALWGIHDRGFDHYRRYTLRRLQLLWEGLPVKELLTSYCNTRLYPLVKMARWMSRISRKSLGGAQTDLSLPPKPINTLFYTIFAGESRRLERVLKKRAKPYRRGVSVFAVLERKDGTLIPRNFPENLERDSTPWRK
jgi:hypothetical protein